MAPQTAWVKLVKPDADFHTLRSLLVDPDETVDSALDAVFKRLSLELSGVGATQIELFLSTKDGVAASPPTRIGAALRTDESLASQIPRDSPLYLIASVTGRPAALPADRLSADFVANMFSRILHEVVEAKSSNATLASQVAALVAAGDGGAASETTSVVTFSSVRGAEYEHLANSVIHVFLAEYCGLSIRADLPTSVAATESGKLDSQWDGKFFLSIVEPWVPRPLLAFVSKKHVLYGQHSAGEGAGYSRPGTVRVGGRPLTPTKAYGGVSTRSDWKLAVFEFTMLDNWSADSEITLRSPLHPPTSPSMSPGKQGNTTLRKSLLPRLNARLANALSRARQAANEAGVPPPARVSDVVAVVGVVGQSSCKESVNDLLGSAAGQDQWPLLHEMMDRRRFVFFHLIAAERQTELRSLE